MEEKKPYIFKMEHNLDIGKVIGKITEGGSAENDFKDIGIRLTESIKNSLRGMSDSWVNDFYAKVKSGDTTSAYHIFNEKKNLLQLSGRKEHLQKLSALNPQSLTKPERKCFWLSVNWTFS